MLTLLPTTQSFLRQIGTNTIQSTKFPHNRPTEFAAQQTVCHRSSTTNLPRRGIPTNTERARTNSTTAQNPSAEHARSESDKHSRRSRRRRRTDGRGSPAWPLCLARSSGGVIRRTTASASASYTVAAAIAWAARREPEVPEGEDRGRSGGRRRRRAARREEETGGGGSGAGRAACGRPGRRPTCAPGAAPGVATSPWAGSWGDAAAAVRGEATGNCWRGGRLDAGGAT